MLELAAWIQPFEIKPAEIFCLRMVKQKLWLTFYLRQLFTQEPFNDNGNSNLVNDFKNWLEHFRKDYFWGGWECLGHQRQLRGNHFWGDLQVSCSQPSSQHLYPVQQRLCLLWVWVHPRGCWRPRADTSRCSSAKPTTEPWSHLVHTFKPFSLPWISHAYICCFLFKAFLGYDEVIWLFAS